MAVKKFEVGQRIRIQIVFPGEIGSIQVVPDEYLQQEGEVLALYAKGKILVKLDKFPDQPTIVDPKTPAQKVTIL